MTANDNEVFEFVTSSFKKLYNVRVLEANDKFLGFIAKGNGSTARLHNAIINERQVRHFKMRKSKPMSTSLSPGLNLDFDDDGLPTEVTLYRELVERLLHSANTVLSDIGVAVGYMPRSISKPACGLWKAAKIDLPYVFRMREMGTDF